MGSVQSNMECPRCKSEDCFSDFYYNTGEEYISCPDCGYHRSFFFKRDENGKFIKKDETKDAVFDNLVGVEVHLENPLGAYRIEVTQGAATCGTLDNEEQYKEFVEHISGAIKGEHNIKEAVISKFINGKIEKEVVFQSAI